MYWFLFILSLVGLVFAGDWLVKGASGVAVKANLSKAVIGLTIVSAGTSAPEFVVSLIAVMNGSSDISVGNVIGSNIFNIALILGITAIFYPILSNREVIRKDWPVMMAASLLFWFFLRDGLLDRMEGLMIFIGFITFIIYSLKKGKVEEDFGSVDEPTWKLWMFVLVGVAGLAGFARLMVYSAEIIAADFGISERIIGLTLFALGTSMPELITSIVAAYRKESAIILGNIVGSNIFNIMLVMATVSMIEPIQASKTLVEFDAIWMLGIAGVLLPIMLIKNKITRVEGGILLAILGFYFYQIF